MPPLAAAATIPFVLTFMLPANNFSLIFPTALTTTESTGGKYDLLNLTTRVGHDLPGKQNGTAILTSCMHDYFLFRLHDSSIVCGIGKIHDE